MKAESINVVGSIILLVIIGLVFWFVVAGHGEFLGGVLAGALPSWIVWEVGKRKEKRDHRAWLLRDERAYLSEIVNIHSWLAERAKEKKMSEEEMQKELLAKIQDLRPAMLLWGKPAVLRVWLEMETLSGIATSGKDGAERIVKFSEKLFRVVRKELGHDDSCMQPGEVAGFLLTTEDREQALQICKGEKYD